MQYRIAKPEDLEACSACVASTGYYYQVDFAEIGGLVLLAEDDEGVQGVVWAARSGNIAFADYLAVTPKYMGSGLGARLIIRGCYVLKKMGVKQIRSCVHYDNREALRIDSKLGALDGPYAQSVIVL